MPARPAAFAQLTASLLLALLPATTLPAQDAAPVFKVNTRIVILDVVVTDKKGNVVTDLKQGDFKVLEDSQIQIIKSFEPPDAHTMPTSPDGQPVVASSKDLRKIGNTPVTVLVLDELNTPFADMAFARDSLKKYLLKQPKVLNQPTVLLASGNTKFVLLQDFTQSRAALLAALKAHFPEYPGKAQDEATGLPVRNAMVTRLTQTMQVLNQIAEATRGIPGRKNVVWIGQNAPYITSICIGCGPGHPLNLDPSLVMALKQLSRHMTQVLLEARITLYYVHSQDTMQTTADGRSPRDPEPYDAKDPFDGQVYDFNNFAPVTGGKELRHGNDIDAKIETSVSDGTTYYTLSYSPSDKNDDPAHYRTISIQLTNPDLIATTRGGYYADAPNSTNVVNTPELAEAERKKLLLFEITQSATSPLTYTGLGVTVQKATDANGWQVSVDPSDLSWTPRANSLTAEVTATAVALDKENNLIAHASHELMSSRANSDLPSTVNFQMTFNAPSNTKRIRFIIRDAVTGKIGTADVTP